MLAFLVTATARRRLLELLFGEDARGTAGELAEQAGVGFASAYRELHEMLRYDLLRVERDGNRTVYSANPDHADTGLLRHLVTERPRLSPSKEAVALRRRLRALGAPLAVEPAEHPGPLEETLVEGARLSRRDPVVARALPVALWLHRAELDPDRLAETARRLGQKQAVGFYLELTGLLGGDPHFKRWAARLRDDRVRATQDFFQLPTTPAARMLADRRTPSAARRWGFRLNEDLESFRSLFDRATHAT